MDGNRYWNALAVDWHHQRPQRLWRAYCDELNRRLIETSLSGSRFGRTLKTDLFDEATGATGLTPLLRRRSRSVVGVDLALDTCRFAARNPAAHVACNADVRRLPFATGSFDLVLSNSTLDHFRSVDEIATALAELARVLRPCGRLLLTLDNLANPVIALRRILPFSWLARLRLVPYFVGSTCGPRRLRRLVDMAGLETLQIDSMMHCPRLPAVAACNLMDRCRGDGSAPMLFRLLDRCELLARLPTRFLSGYFITVLAERRAG